MTDLREHIARAIYDAPNDIDSDQLADMLIEDFRISGTPDECREMVLGVCRKAADAALAAIEPLLEAMRRHIRSYEPGTLTKAVIWGGRLI